MSSTKDINKLCQKCECSCKQSKNVRLITCPNFVEKPTQLTFFDMVSKKRTRTKKTK